MTQETNQTSFQICGDTHSPRYLLFLGGDFNCIKNLESDKARGDALAGHKRSAEFEDFVDSMSHFVMFLELLKFAERKLFTRHNKSNTNMLWID